VPPISPPPVASRSSRRVSFIRLSVKRCTTAPGIQRKPEWSGSPNYSGVPQTRCFASPYFATEFFTCEIEDFTGLLVRSYAPVDHHLLRDLLPDGRGGQVAVVERPVVVAARVVRLAHHHDHRELGVLGGKEPHERGPDVGRLLPVDPGLGSSGLPGLVG